MASSAGDPWTYTPPLSLWHLVQEHVSVGEQDEIKSMLGTSLVETTLDLHTEVRTLLEIWQDFKEETESDNSSNRPLAEPPDVRERLIQEICFLAESIREKSASKGVNPSQLLSRHNSQVLEYAEETQRCGSSLGSARPQSANSSDGRQTPLTTTQHANSRFDLDSAICKEVSSANDKLNYLQFDEVCNRLRETLTKELEQLEADVAFLHSCLTDSLDDPNDRNNLTLSREPTLTDLKEERSLLEKDLLSTESLPNTPPVHKPPFVPSSSAAAAVKIPALGPISTNKLRPTQTTSTASSTKNAPLKASHHIAKTLPLSSDASTSAGGTGPVSQRTGSASKTAASPQVSTRNGDPQAGPKLNQSGNSSGGRSHAETWEKDKATERPAPQGRMHSAARVKVVPVGSVLEPRVDSAGSRSLMPTPPPPTGEASHGPRPSSAQRFRRMVMSCRETTQEAE